MRVLAALAVASVASAVFQLLLIKIAEFIFGPYNETFALVLATVLLGLALGSLAVGRFGLTFNGAMLLCLAGLAWIIGRAACRAGRSTPRSTPGPPSPTRHWSCSSSR